MVYPASVVRVMIASPSDVVEARDAVEAALNGWNGARAEKQGVILQPRRWETGAVPILGDSAQALINSQLLDQSDIVIALFGSRLGSPTPSAVSGTVEEIERAVVAGKPVHLYFSTAPLPNDVDTRQLDGLREFKKAIQDRGLYGEYTNSSELNAEVWRAIEHDLAALDLTAPAPAAPAEPVTFVVQMHRGARPTDYFITITNRSSTTDAEDVLVEQHGEWAGRVLVPWSGKTTIHAGQTREMPVALFMGMDTDPRAIRIDWTSDGAPHSKVFHIG